jgi:NAD-dependent SIR2 family protein deacetylase
MVGAGFSLNAEPLAGTHSRFPDWRELARAMFDGLPPRASDTEESCERRFNSASPLRIASEYEAEFGPRKLELLIRERIPNLDYQPGELHRLLLQLPWADVFTTNYDTLLERTEVNGRAYQPVARPSELTTAFAPRIVKLHGTLPLGPLILSEEDYRTYPREFAPFVNCVRES